MIRAFIPLCVGALCSIAAGAQIAAISPATAAAVAAAAVNCETPTASTMTPAPNSEPDMVSQMEAWWAQKEAISQMEAWWQQRTKLGRAMTRKPGLSVQHRRHRDYPISPTEFDCPPSGCFTPDDPGLGGPINSADTRKLNEDELSELGRAMSRELGLPVEHRRYRDHSILPTEFDCPPSGCVTPDDSGLGGSINSANKRDLSDDELSAIRWLSPR
jgi:hypothetical protein